LRAGCKHDQFGKTGAEITIILIEAVRAGMPSTDSHSAHDLRPARPDEAAALTELALAAKAGWGYDADFMARCRDIMTISPDAIRRHPHYLIENVDGDLLGFYGFDLSDGLLTLDWLFVAPASQGQGIGRRLFQHAVTVARTGQFSYFQIISDPHAEPFYVRLGAVRCGNAMSDLHPHRLLPVLRLDLRQIAPITR
jgi:GNAT superfamily N-acetyltransferase